MRSLTLWRSAAGRSGVRRHRLVSRPIPASDQGRGDLVPKAKPGIKRRLGRFNGLGPESSVISAELAYEQFGLGTVLLRVLPDVPIEVVAKRFP